MAMIDPIVLFAVGGDEATGVPFIGVSRIADVSGNIGSRDASFAGKSCPLLAAQPPPALHP
jgi:hypothetical protein